MNRKALNSQVVTCSLYPIGMASLKKRQKIALCSMMNFLAFHSRQVSLTIETQNYNLLLGVRSIVSIGSVHFVTNTDLVGRTYDGEVISEGDVVCYLKGGYSPVMYFI